MNKVAISIAVPLAVFFSLCLYPIYGGIAVSAFWHADWLDQIAVLSLCLATCIMSALGAAVPSAKVILRWQRMPTFIRTMVIAANIVMLLSLLHPDMGDALYYVSFQIGVGTRLLLIYFVAHKKGSLKSRDTQKRCCRHTSRQAIEQVYLCCGCLWADNTTS